MKITICGSMAFFEQMLMTKKQLEGLGHEVKTPPSFITDDQGQEMSVSEYYRLRKTPQPENSWIWEKKTVAMLNHFHKVAWSDAILVLNYDKNNIPGYIGANTFMEMGLALYLEKPIYLLNPAPSSISYYEEILGCHPTIINNNLAAIPI